MTNDDILVSISCITYNHGSFLRECLDSLVGQKTDFRFEIILHDDASTDGTQEIVREYVDKYPEILFPIIQVENQFSQGVRGMMTRFNFPRCRGKYIAICEGDDYWIDPLKLQKQVDFLESNQDYAMCFHNAYLYYQETDKKEIFRPLEEREYSASEILRTWTIPTASVLFRKDSIDFSGTLNPRYIYGDIIMFLTIAEHGKIWCMKDPMSVYRIHPGGMTSERMTIKKLELLILHQKQIQKDFSQKYAKILDKDIAGSLMFLSFLQLKEGRISSLKSGYESLKY
ncbi:MAG: glycosyltransferase, partial [Flavobacterium sp.]